MAVRRLIFPLVIFLVGVVSPSLSAGENTSGIDRHVLEFDDPSNLVDLSQRRGVQEMVISVKFLDQTIETYQEIAGWELVYRGQAPKEQAVHWGLPEDTVIQEAIMRAPGMEKMFARLVQFQGVDQVRIRSSARPFDTGGIFNINMLVKDLEGSFETMRDRGFSGFADPTYYTLFDNQYGGAMLRGHDGVVVNLLYRVNRSYDDVEPFEKMSAIRNSTQMIGDFASFDANVDFFQNKMGWYKRWEASPSWPEDGSNNMSIPESMIRDGLVKERAAGFMFDPEADGGTIEIFSFEGVSGKDFSSRAHPPNLGILMYRAHVPDVEAYVKQISDNGVEIVRPMMALDIAPYGQVRSAIARAPSGAWIEVFEQVSK